MGMSRVEVAVLLVTSVTQATTRQSIRFRTHGSKDERPVSWFPSQSERPEACANGQSVVSPRGQRPVPVIRVWSV